MSDYSSVAPPQNFNKSQAFAAAVQRAKQIAAKINPSSGGGNEGGSHKRHSDNETLSSEPELKKHARYEPHSPPTPQPQPHHQQTIHAQNNARSQMAPNLNLSGPVTSEDIKVPDKMVGLIIGRGGEQITRLQSESGCKIQMAPDSGGMPDRLCTLTGNAAAIGRAKELVNAIVNQRYKTEGPGGGGGGGGSGGMMRGPPDDMPQRHGGSGGGGPSFVEVMVPGPKVGLIIGKGGETIKMLQEKSGAKMVVIQEGPNQEVEKPLRITGDPQKVEHARSLVYELLAEKETQQTRNAPRQQNRNSGFNERRGGFSNRGEESQFVVPAAKCGVIIGRGGETIKQINQATGAHCELDRRPNNNPNEKVFIIRGTSEQIESAKQMISDKIGLGSNGGPNYNQSSGPNNSQGNYSQSWAPQGPSYGQPYHQQHMDPDGGGMGSMGSGGQNQADYSQQWIEYYRSLGLHQEADEIEHQTKSKQGQNNTMATNAPPSVPQPTPSGPPTGQQNGQPDYSAQWAQYYRSLGKHKEAELIEQQMKTKQSAQMPVGGQNPSNPSSFPYQQPGYPYQPVAYPYQPSGNYQYSGSQPQQNQE